MRIAAATLAGLTALTAGAIYLNLQVDGADGPRRTASAAASGSATYGDTTDLDTTLLFGTSRPDDGEPPEMKWLTLLLLDEARKRGAVLYIPAHTAAEVPGRGLLPLTDAYASGRAGLLGVSVENMLDLEIDRTAELSDEEAEKLFDAAGALTVEVPVEVRVGEGDGARLLLPAGVQDLSSGGLVNLLYVVGLDSDDAELGSRHLAFWQAFLASLADDAAAREEALRTVEGLPVSGSSAESLGESLGSLAALPPLERDLIVLPVEQAGTGSQDLFEMDVEATQETLGSLVEGSFGEDEANGVQVLNGNGEPGVGAEVGEKLVRGGFRVVLSGNAPRLDYSKTLVITYDRTAAGLALAEEARDLLGVGQVQVAGQQQGIVDLTVVVGKDYLRQES